MSLTRYVERVGHRLVREPPRCCMASSVMRESDIDIDIDFDFDLDLDIDLDIDLDG